MEVAPPDHRFFLVEGTEQLCDSLVDLLKDSPAVISIFPQRTPDTYFISVQPQPDAPVSH